MDAIRVNLHAWALHFAAQAWHVLPITPSGKKPPVIDRWETRASTDPSQINRWWQHTPHTIGIATGPSTGGHRPGHPQARRDRADQWAALGIGSGAGVLRALARQHDTTVTPTFAATTPSGGWHLYYTAPAGAQLRNTQARYLPPSATAATNATAQLNTVANTNEVAAASATYPRTADQPVADATATAEVTATNLTSQVAAVTDMANPEGKPR